MVKIKSYNTALIQLLALDDPRVSIHWGDSGS